MHWSPDDRPGPVVFPSPFEPEVVEPGREEVDLTLRITFTRLPGVTSPVEEIEADLVAAISDHLRYLHQGNEDAYVEVHDVKRA